MNYLTLSECSGGFFYRSIVRRIFHEILVKVDHFFLTSVSTLIQNIDRHKMLHYCVHIGDTQMRATIAIDDALFEEAFSLSNVKTKKGTHQPVVAGIYPQKTAGAPGRHVFLGRGRHDLRRAGGVPHR